MNTNNIASVTSVNRNTKGNKSKGTNGVLQYLHVLCIVDMEVVTVLFWWLNRPQ